MRVDRFLRFLPGIEAAIVAARLDCLVMGLGPTAWLVPHMRQSIFDGIRFVGAHDAFRIRPVHDLVIFDQPVHELNPDSDRHRHLVESRPERLFAYEPNLAAWRSHLPPELLAMAQPVPMRAWPPGHCTGLEPFQLEADPIHTIAVSPTGCTTLAWKLGYRRIGVIGCDMMHGHHGSVVHRHAVDAFFIAIAKQAFERDGVIVNLSPCTSLAGFNMVSAGLLRDDLAFTAQLGSKP